MSYHGLVLPSWLYKPERRHLADEAFRTLNLTDTSQFAQKPVLLVLTKGAWGLDLSGIHGFQVEVQDCTSAHGTEQTLAYGTGILFQEYSCDHVTWLGDDALFHPDWMNQLAALIERHPEALAWSVYRSAYTRVHQTIKEENGDVLVSSICGHGLTLPKREWEAWGVDWKAGHWISPYGDTLDMFHIYARPQSVGERWVTRRSYIDHTGKVGMHCTGIENEVGQGFSLL